MSRKNHNIRKHKPPYSHREIAEAMFKSNTGENNVFTWLKIEFYTLFMIALPYLITIAVCAVILTALYVGVKFF